MSNQITSKNYRSNIGTNITAETTTVYNGTSNLSLPMHDLNNKVQDFVDVENINVNDVEPKKLSPEQVAKLVKQYLKYMTPELRTKYEETIMKQWIHGETMLQIADDQKEQEEIMKLLELPYGHRKDFQKLLRDLKTRQQQIKQKSVTPGHQTNPTLPSITQNLTSAGAVIGNQKNIAGELTLHNGSTFHNETK